MPMDTTWTPPAGLVTPDSWRKPSWMTDTTELPLPSPERPARQNRRRLSFGDEPAPAPATRLRHADLYDVDPWADVDFPRMASEQEEQARRLGRTPPAQEFRSVHEIEGEAGSRLEKAIAAASARWPDLPIVALFAKAPDSTPGARPVLLYRCHHLHGYHQHHLHGIIVDESGKPWEASAHLASEAERTTLPVHLKGSETGVLPADEHFMLRVIESGTKLLASEWIMQLGSAAFPMRLACVFAQQGVLGFQALLLGNDTPPPVKNAVISNFADHPSYDGRVRALVLRDSFAIEISLDDEDMLRWRRRRHPLARHLPSGEFAWHTRTVAPGTFCRLAAMDVNAFYPAPREETNRPADKGDVVIEKHLTGNAVFYAREGDAPALYAALMTLVPKRK